MVNNWHDFTACRKTLKERREAFRLRKRARYSNVHGPRQIQYDGMNGESCYVGEGEELKVYH